MLLYARGHRGLCPPSTFSIPAISAAMSQQSSAHSSTQPHWYSLSYALGFMLRKKGVLGWSLLLFFATVALTIVGYDLSTTLVDHLAGGFLTAPQNPSGAWAWIKFASWEAGRWLFLLVTRVAAFYIAFIVAYCLTTPGYSFLSSTVEKLHLGKLSGDEQGLRLADVVIDLVEGIKIGLFGLLITAAALLIGFIPGVGQAAVFILYCFYSTLMFIDYPASRRRWSLGRKLHWLRGHGGKAFRLGLLPALIGMVPLVNVFLLSLLFPLFTVQSTLNFAAIEEVNGADLPARETDQHGR